VRATWPSHKRGIPIEIAGKVRLRVVLGAEDDAAQVPSACAIGAVEKAALAGAILFEDAVGAVKFSAYDLEALFEPIPSASPTAQPRPTHQNGTRGGQWGVHDVWRDASFLFPLSFTDGNHDRDSTPQNR
jgi:hypothetical protein